MEQNLLNTAPSSLRVDLPAFVVDEPSRKIPSVENAVNMVGNFFGNFPGFFQEMVEQGVFSFT